MTEYLLIGDLKLEYIIRSSPRSKRHRIEVSPQGIEVFSPKNASLEETQHFVNTQKQWLFAHAQDHFSKTRKPKQQQYASGAQIYVQGRNCTMKIVPKDVHEICVLLEESLIFWVPCSWGACDVNQQLPHALQQFFRQKTAEKVRKCCSRYGVLLGVNVSDITLIDSARYWGRCTKDQILQIDWRLIQAPSYVLEFVVLYALLVFLYPKKGQEFSIQLHQMMPTWKKSKDILEEWVQKEYFMVVLPE